MDFGKIPSVQIRLNLHLLKETLIIQNRGDPK